MEFMKKYMVYIDDGRDCFRVAVPAESEIAAREYVKGNGEVIAVKDITKDYLIHLDKISELLKDSYFNQVEIDLIVRLLTFYKNGECL